MSNSFNPYLKADTVDDLMRQGFEALLSYGSIIEPSKGKAKELCGVTLELSNPRARLSQSATRGKLLSALGELCWYLSGSDDAKFMSYYIKDYEEHADKGSSSYPIVNGAYGPRVFSSKHPNQFEVVKDILSRKSDSRQAVIQIFSQKDISELHVDVPCTCLLQFMIRNDKLNLLVYMRSNDIYWGLPHDLFSFTMLQEIMSSDLNVEIGSYKHIIGSFHLYEPYFEDAKKYLNEGYFSREFTMPLMPSDPWDSIRTLLKAERELREEGRVSENINNLDSYWLDLIRLLEIFRHKKDKNKTGDKNSRSLLSNNFYKPYISAR
jgi:thymidylate synthase